MTINRIDMEEITDRYAELRDERADLLTATEEAEAAQDEAEEDEAEDAEADHASALAALNDWDSDNGEELKELAELIEELRGAGGGDHQWEGDWFPSELIAEDDFEEYARDLAEDCYSIPDTWPHRCIDWEQAACELAQDYSSVEYQGKSYYWR